MPCHVSSSLRTIWASSPLNANQCSEFPSSKCSVHIGRRPAVLEILISANFMRELTVSFIINLIKSICSKASLTTCSSVLSCLMTYGVWVQKLHILLTWYPNAHKHSSYFTLSHSGDIDMTRKLLSEHFDCLYWPPIFAVNSFSTREDLRTALITYGRSTCESIRG